MEFAVAADHRIKLKENGKKVKYLEPVKELKMLCNMKVTIILFAMGALSTIGKGLIQG